MEVQKKKYSKGLKWFVFLSVFFLVVVIGLSSGSGDKQTEQKTEAVATEQTDASKKEAQEGLEALLALSKQSGIVASYEFSDTANVVYVTDVWYSLDVPFKKDLVGKIASLKEAATGYHTFQVMNVKSNEKVAEVTSFSGSIEIYK